jgi:hypothetical protein
MMKKIVGAQHAAPATLKEIEELTEAFALERSFLLEHLRDMERAIQKVRKQYEPVMSKRLEIVGAVHGRLRVAIEANPELFERPKTVTFHGVKIGYQKQKGKIEWEDEASVIAKIKDLLPNQADMFIATFESPIKTALEQLDAATLKRLGVSVVEAGDKVVIRPVDSAEEKALRELLKDVFVLYGGI